MHYKIALFGEAEKGEFRSAHYCQTLPQLMDTLGNPPPESHGLDFAIQALLFHRDIIFFRVREEGFSTQDYLLGLHYLESKQDIPHLAAICLPGVGDAEIIHASAPICRIHHSVLVVTESDLYDYLTSLAS